MLQKAGIAGCLAMATMCFAESEYALTYSNSELATSEGRQVVYQRIVRAAKRYCPDYGEIRSRRDVRSCVDGVVRDLVSKIPHPEFTAEFAATKRVEAIARIHR